MQMREETSTSPTQDQFLKHTDPNASWDPAPVMPVLEKMPSSSGFSYAISASRLSAPLQDLPMFPNMVLRYSNQTPIVQMEFPLVEFPLIRVSGTNYPAYESGSGQGGGLKYLIEVLLTPFQHREYFKHVILEKAIPLLAEWLNGPEHPVAPSCRVAIECWYEVANGRVVVRAGN